VNAQTGYSYTQRCSTQIPARATTREYITAWLKLICAAFLTLSANLTAAPSCHAESEQTPALHEPAITIGGIFCLPGEIASGCNAIREGAEVAADAINQSGGIQGRPLRLDIQDSHYVPRDAHTLAQRFASNDAILGVLITGIVETKAAAAPLERANMSYMTLWDSAPEIEGLGDYSFGIGPSELSAHILKNLRVSDQVLWTVPM
jgi:branched-chain amino acid transport system substrate-binding protein